MNSRLFSAALCAALGIAPSAVLADLNTSSPVPPSTGNIYTCGDPNNHPDDPCPDCDDSEEDSGSDPSASSGTSGPDTGDTPDGKQCPVESPGGGVNPNTGGVESQTTDISSSGATGDMPLSFRRYYQTRDTTANGDLMGHGRTFTHSYSWSMSASGSGGTSRSILMPGGATLNFVPYPGTTDFEGQTAIRYIPQTGFGQRLFQVGDWYYLLVPGGERYAFERVTDAQGFTRYFPRSRRDGKGNIHTFTTDSAARITKVTDAAGNWIQLTYAGVPIDRKQNVPIATITAPPVVGWNEITVSTPQPFQWLQGISAPNLNFNMSEIEFYKPGVNGGPAVKLSGTPFGNSPGTTSAHTFDKLFDGNTATGFAFIRASMGIAGIDLGAGNASHVSKIRYFISSFNANRLASFVGHQFVGRVSSPQIVTVLSQVTTSAGDQVNYIYDTYTDPSILQEHLVLKTIDYVRDTDGDGDDDLTDDATLTWTTSLEGYAPHVQRMTEPRKSGPHPDVSFEYLPITIAPAKGMPFKVRQGANGTPIFSIENMNTRRYVFADGGVHTIYNNPASGDFMPSTSTDAAGKTTTYTWTADRRFLASKTTLAGTTNYTWNYMGQPLTIVHPDGLTETRTYDVQGRLLTKALSAPGYPTRTTTYTRDSATGRITKITYPDGSFENYTYNPLGLLASVREKNGSFTVHTYDTASGSPTAGLRLSTTTGLASATATSGGETTTFTWTSLNEPGGSPARLVKSVTDPRGRVTTYGYDATGRPNQTTYPDGSFRQLAYDAFGNKTIEFDGSSTDTWTYDLFRRPVTHTNGAGGVTTYDYGLNGSSCSCYGAGAPTLVTSPAGRKTRRVYDLKGRLTQEIQGYLTADAATTTHTYDVLGRRTSTTGPDGHVTTFSYDSMGRKLSSSTLLTSNSALLTSHTYSPFGDTLTTTLPGGRTTTMAYDKMSRPVTITDPLGTVTAITYDLGGRRTAVTEASGSAQVRTTQFAYNAFDRLTTTTYPDGSTTSKTYHPGGEIHTSTDELGRTTTSDTTLVTWTDSENQTWNSFARSSTDPAGNTTTAYGPPMAFTGGTRRIVSAAGRIAESYMDELGRTTLQRSGLVTPASGLSADVSDTVITYDPDGFLLSTIVDPDGLNLVTTHTSDAVGRVKTTTDPLNRTTVFNYDKRGNLITITLPDNRQHTATFDALSRQVSTTDPKNQTITYTYWNETSQKLTLTDARNFTTSWTYNLRGQLLTKVYPNGDDHVYTYDTLGRMATHTTPKNEVCTYGYDLRDRQTLANWNSATPDTAKTYWANGLLKSIDNGISKSDYAYSNRNLLTSEKQTLSGRPARVVQYQHDADGLRTKTIYPGGQTADYTWTARGQLRTVNSDLPPPPDLATYTYDKAGRNTALVHENGIAESKSYDAASQLLANTHLKNGTPVSGHGYTLDATGRRTDETFADGTTPAREYHYDNADQVTSADYGNSQSDTYAYDEMGNRTSASFSRSVGVSPTNGTVTYNANDANQYTSITGLNPISHDANGNLLQKNGVLYTWDSENRLMSVAPAVPALGDKSLVHTYDGQHRRVTRTIREWTVSGWDETEKIHFIYDGWNVIEEYDITTSNSVLVRNLTWGQDLGGAASLQGAGGVGGLLMVEEITGTTTTAYHFHYDGNGNVTEVTDLNGNSAATYRYDAFGNTLVSTGSYAASNRYRFSTKPLDSEVPNAPLYYYGYRYYDPTTGRWLSRDPIEERGGVNLFGFVKNNAISRIDAIGLAVFEYEMKGPKTEKTSYAGGGWTDDSYLYYHGHTFVSDLDTHVADEESHVMIGASISYHMHIDTFPDTDYRGKLRSGPVYKITHKIKNGKVCCKAKLIEARRVFEDEKLEGLGVGYVVDLEDVETVVPVGSECKWRASITLSFGYTGSSSSGWEVNAKVSGGSEKVGAEIGGGLSGGVTGNWQSTINLKTSDFTFEKNGRLEE